MIKAADLAKAVRMLPNAKTYTPDTVFVQVEKVKYAFLKQGGEWYFDYKKSTNQ